MNTFKVGVVIGRFQPLLREQFENIIVPALDNSDLVIVLIGSANRARTCRDPFSYDEREDMISAAIKDYDSAHPEIICRPLKDSLYSDTNWMVQTQAAVRESVLEFGIVDDYEVTLYGLMLGSEQNYLNLFPQWKLYYALNQDEHNFRDNDEIVRESMYNADGCWYESVLESSHEIIEDWLLSEEGERIVDEFFYIEKYKERTQVGKYPIIFQTVDNVVLYKGNVLLVKRRSKPGQGLWALPGGFLEANETLLDGAVRELKEETRLNVKPEWLISRDTFDAPDRSLRGRTITHVFLWKIPDYREVPQIKAGSDAAKVRWFSLSEVMDQMSTQMFEDHLDIIEAMVKRG